MKRTFQVLAAVLALAAISTISLEAATARENKRLREGKITKNEAEHLVLKQFPGAKITSCELTRGEDHSVWVLNVIKAGGHDATKVQVDGRTGKILQ
ncbi:MAG: PepSY domain-containing protein [Verrucomicrobiota bacterium]|nr:PepSY domain-containing protein [Verrucomicrobiota bacterium]